jgi:hypothetical protein
MKKSLFISSLFLFSTLAWSQISTMSSSSSLGMATAQAAAIVDPPPPAPNVVAFDYDDAGNQTKRRFIYVAGGIYRQTNPITKNEIVAEKQLIESDIFSDILYYPNPVQSELFLKWKNSEVNYVDRIELYSLSGQLIKSISTIKNVEETTIDFQSLPSGYYNLLLLYSSGEAKDLKIIKK